LVSYLHADPQGLPVWYLLPPSRPYPIIKQKGGLPLRINERRMFPNAYMQEETELPLAYMPHAMHEIQTRASRKHIPVLGQHTLISLDVPSSLDKRRLVT
jgi:hypothetical protein